MSSKKIIIFGCSFIPLLTLIAGVVIYSFSSKNNVHQNQQNNLQFQEKKKEINPNIDKVKNKRKKKKAKRRKKKVNIQTEEEYIPCLDNYKVQISLWFVYPLIFIFLIDNTSAESYYHNLKNKINEELRDYTYLVSFFICLLIVLLVFLVGEFFASFIVYLPACWINKKPCQKAFSVYHRFWCQSWTKVLLSFLIIEIFGFIDFVFLEPLLKYVAGFIILKILK